MGPIIAIGHFPDLDEENEMTELRQRMTDAMVRRGLAERTKESYLAGVTGLAKYDWLSPDTLDAEAIQASRLPLITEKKLAYTSVNPAACAFRFLFATVLGQKSVAFDILMNQVPKRRSQVLTRDEVQRLFVQCGDLRSRAVRMTTYAAGLRLSEVCALPLGDIESAPDQMGIKVRQGKGGQDRYTRLSPRLLDPLRLSWRARRPRLWLFPNRSGDGPLFDQTAQRMSHAARRAAGMEHGGGIYTWRHAFATHLLEAGVDIHTIPRLMGQGHVRTTTRYFHLAHTHLIGPPRHSNCSIPTERRPCQRSAWPECWPHSAQPIWRDEVPGERGSPCLACDPRLSHRDSGGPHRDLRSLRDGAARRSFVPQPALPAMSDPREGGVDCRTAARSAARAVLPPRVHAAA